LQKSFQRTAPRPTIEPDQDFVASKLVLGWEKPEIKLRLLFWFVGDWQETSVGLSNVEVDVRNRSSRAIDDEF